MKERLMPAWCWWLVALFAPHLLIPILLVKFRRGVGLVLIAFVAMTLGTMAGVALQ
jgi:hypothetical protein